MAYLRSRSLFVVLAVSLFVSVVPQEKVTAAPTHIITYSQYINNACPISPPRTTGELAGEWTQLCNGSWIGWGAQPYTYCYMETVQTIEGSC
jgi:hypothetical protein